MSEYAPTSFTWILLCSFPGLYHPNCIEEKSMCARHDGTANSRHTDLHWRNVSWWLRTVAVCENCTSSNSQRARDAKEISQGEINTIKCERDSRPLSPRLRYTRGTQEMKKKKKCKVFSVLSLQSCQYEAKWLLNILHQPPKWWEGGDVRVTTAAVY